jgi:hypothetical protein
MAASPAGAGERSKGGRKRVAPLGRRKLTPGGKVSNLDVPERLSTLRCTHREAAFVLGVTAPTFTRTLREAPKFVEAWRRGQAIAHLSLRRLLFRRAEQPDTAGTSIALYPARRLLWPAQG